MLLRKSLNYVRRSCIKRAKISQILKSKWYVSLRICEVLDFFRTENEWNRKQHRNFKARMSIGSLPPIVGAPITPDAFHYAPWFKRSPQLPVPTQSERSYFTGQICFKIHPNRRSNKSTEPCGEQCSLTYQLNPEKCIKWPGGLLASGQKESSEPCDVITVSSFQAEGLHWKRRECILTSMPTPCFLYVWR